MTAFLLTLLFQSSPLLPPRTAMENPAAVSEVPRKLAKDYAGLWKRFMTGKDDAKTEKALDNLLKKEKTFDPALTIEGYLHLYAHDDAGARQKFQAALAINPKNRIAAYFLAEIAFERQEYAAAAGFYAQVLTLDPSRSEIDTKRERAQLLAADGVLRSGARAEEENRLPDAEQAYRQALTILPKEANLHQHLADLLTRENKTAEAEAERKIAGELRPRGADSSAASNPANAVSADTLDDLGRWGGDIKRFHDIRSAESITREQLAALLVRYFPQLMELRQRPQIVTDAQDSWASSEIRTVVGLSLIDPLPNHTFEPSTIVTRGDLALTMGRLMRLLSVSPKTSSQPIAAPDLASTSALYKEAQLVLDSGVMTLQDSGSFNVSGVVSGREAVRSAETLNRIFQQLPH